MHSKQKGSLGEGKVLTDLLSKNYPVFKEFGDLSRVDLIILDGTRAVKIQVKCFSEKAGKVTIPSTKSGPNYKFNYSEEDVDVFAVYVPERDIILYVSSKEVCSNKSSMDIRFNKPRNNQKTKVRMAVDYQDFERVLRGQEPNT